MYFHHHVGLYRDTLLSLLSIGFNTAERCSIATSVFSKTGDPPGHADAREASPKSSDYCLPQLLTFGVTMESLSPIMLFMSVLLPTFGLPTMVT